MKDRATSPSSDDAPLLAALGFPCLAVWALFAWAQLDLGRAVAWRSSVLIVAATLTVYGLDRWRDRGQSPSWWRWIGAVLLATQAAILISWWSLPGTRPLASLVFFVGGQMAALCYAGVGSQGKGLKHLPGAKAIVVAFGVSLAAVGMVDAFQGQPLPIQFWALPQVQSATAFLLALTGCNAQLFDLRDLERDAFAGVPSAAVLLGKRRAKLFALAWLCLWSGLSFVLAPSLELPAWGSRGLGILVALIQIWRSPFSMGASGYFLALDGALLLPWLVALTLQVLN